VSTASQIISVNYGILTDYIPSSEGFGKIQIIGTSIEQVI